MPAHIKTWLIDWVTPRFRGDQYVLYLAGCLLFSLGASCFIASNLGTDPLDVLSLGLRKHLGVTIGMAQGGFAAACLVVWALWNKRAPILSPFVTFAFCGSLIDIWIWTSAAQQLHLSPVGLLGVGVTLCAYGSSLIIMSGIGIRSMDLVAITMTQKWRLPFWLCKGLMELLLLASGWLLGGPVGVGTITFLVCVGWLIQPLMVLNERLLQMTNYGLRPLAEMVAEVSS